MRWPRPGRTATPDPTPQAGYYYRSDHFSLAKRGVPMFYVDSGEDLVDGGRAAGEAYEADYRDNAYHGPDDEYDPAWNWSGTLQDLRLFYRLGRMLAETGDWPNWCPSDEFRRIRDESCAAARRLLSDDLCAMPARMGTRRTGCGSAFPHDADEWLGDPGAGAGADRRVRQCGRRERAGGAADRARRRQRGARAGAGRAARSCCERRAYGDIWLRDTGPLVVFGATASASRGASASTAGAAST